MMNRNAYPRPEFVRENWTNLCGEWEFEFDFGKTGRERGVYKKEKLERKILVPFCPESELSGVEYKDFIYACWYRKTVCITPQAGERTLLRFEAANHTTEVFVNGVSVGIHAGGYTPFSFDITPHLHAGENSIAVCCEADSRDPREPSGKQSARFASYNCYYTRTTGIYAPVWLENVPETYLENIKMDSDVDNARLFCELTFSSAGEKTVTMEAFLGGKPVGKSVARTTLKTLREVINLGTLALWSPDDPALYDLVITVSAGESTDTVRSYFGMRKIELDEKGMKINGKRIFQRLVLDQGFYPGGVYTAPDDEAFARDIEIAKRIGFNGARLHERVFERRFLYEADKRGYIVWGEYPNWGFDHTNDEYFSIYLTEWLEAVARDYNHPSIVLWCPINETWDKNGHRQSDALVRGIYEATKRADPARPCIDTSGNFHVKTDIYDIHDYRQDIAEFASHYDNIAQNGVYDNYPARQKYRGEPYLISEYGGIKWAKAKENDEEVSWGYGNAPKTVEEYAERFEKLTEILLGTEKVCGLCYTQLYDVEQEQNGIYYYDRTPKFSEEIMDKLADAMKKKAKIEE